jgi:hypothetical protein
MVKFWNKNKAKTEEKERPARLQKMSEDELRGWLNSSLMELGATYDRWSYNRGESAEFNTVLNVVNDLWNELQSRESK